MSRQLSSTITVFVSRYHPLSNLSVCIGMFRNLDPDSMMIKKYSHLKIYPNRYYSSIFELMQNFSTSPLSLFRVLLVFHYYYNSPTYTCTYILYIINAHNLELFSRYNNNNWFCWASLYIVRVVSHSPRWTPKKKEVAGMVFCVCLCFESAFMCFLVNMGWFDHVFQCWRSIYIIQTALFA